MNLFEKVKDNVTAREAAEFYGIHVKSSGMAKCIFHDDKNPSMKLDRRFHCFGCQADGDVIDLAAQLFGLPPYQAALKLAADFGIPVPEPDRKTDGQESRRSRKGGGRKAPLINPGEPSGNRNAPAGSARRSRDSGIPSGNTAKTEGQEKERRIRRLERQIHSWTERAEATLLQYLRLLTEWERKYRPEDPEDVPHPLFCEAAGRRCIVEYQLDTLLQGTEADRLDFS